MLDAAPLPNGFSGHNRVVSLMHSGIMPGPTSLDRQASANSGATFDSGSEPYSVPRINGLHVSTRPSHTRTQRQFSGDLASTSYNQPPAANRLPRNFSLNQHSASQVIDLDDDSPLPMRQRGQRNPVGNRQLQAGSFDQEDSFVDLTGESPPVAHGLSRPANRVQLDSIGSHLLRSTSSDLESHQHSSQHAQQRRPIHISNSRHTSSNYSLGPTFDDGLYGLQSGSIANASPDDNEAAGYLDVHSSYPSQMGTGSERPQAQRSSRGQPARRASAQIRRNRSDQNRYKLHWCFWCSTLRELDLQSVRHCTLSCVRLPSMLLLMLLAWLYLIWTDPCCHQPTYILAGTPAPQPGNILLSCMILHHLVPAPLKKTWI